MTYRYIVPIDYESRALEVSVYSEEGLSQGIDYSIYIVPIFEFIPYEVRALEVSVYGEEALSQGIDYLISWHLE